jgi:hypothetical protein
MGWTYNEIDEMDCTEFDKVVFLLKTHKEEEYREIQRARNHGRN